MEFVKEQRKLKLFAPPFPRWFWVMENNVILVSFSKEWTFPVNLLTPKFSVHRLEALDIEIGIDLVNWFPWMVNISKFGRVLPMSNGRCPWIWFNPISITVIEEILKNKGWIIPDNEFKFTQNNAYTLSYLQMYQEATNTPKHGAKPKLELIQKNKVSIIP